MRSEIFSITDASILTGISAATLRRWDKIGRIKFKRNASGWRVLTASDIEKIQELAGITKTESATGNAARVDISR